MSSGELSSRYFSAAFTIIPDKPMCCLSSSVSFDRIISPDSGHEIVCTRVTKNYGCVPNKKLCRF